MSATKPAHGRVLVIALNPSIDAEWRIEQVHWEEKNEVLSERRWAGGKGVNVARWLRHLGQEAMLLTPLGGATGRELARHLRQEKLAARRIPLRQPTRVNIIVTPTRGRQLRFNPVWQRLSPAEWRAVLQASRACPARAKCLVLSGSLPRGAPVTAYAQIIRGARRAGVPCLLDCDGPPFAAALPAHPFLVKPNEHELAQWIGHPLGSATAVMRAAKTLSAIMRGWVLVSRGPRGGLLVHAAQGIALTARAPQVRVVNTVGAGDALLAAVVGRLLSGAAPADCLRWGIGVGTAATMLPAGQLPSRAAMEACVAQVKVTSPTVWLAARGPNTAR